MKVKLLRLSYCDYLGAGNASLEMVKRLRGKGVDAELVVLQKTVADDYVKGFYDCTTEDGRNSFLRFRRRRDKLKCHIMGWPVSKYCYFDIQLASASARKILKLYGDRPDIISVGWVTDFVSFRTIRILQKKTKAKVIYDMVDNAPITGGCHYPWDCDGYKHNCYPCPALRWHFHLSQITLARKHRNLSPYMAIMGTTNDCNRAKESYLFKDNEIVPSVYLVPNPYTFPREAGRNKWKIPNDKFVFFVGASFLNEERKGMNYLVKAFDIFKLNNEISNVVILVAGNGDLKLPLDYNVVSVGTLGSEDLFKAFCCSDAFVCPSVEESGPMMINYAFQANIPVVCFNMGVALDLIRHKENGYVAELFDSKDMANGLSFVYKKGKNFDLIEKINSCIREEVAEKKSYDAIFL